MGSPLMRKRPPPRSFQFYALTDSAVSRPDDPTFLPGSGENLPAASQESDRFPTPEKYHHARTDPGPQTFAGRSGCLFL